MCTVRCVLLAYLVKLRDKICELLMDYFYCQHMFEAGARDGVVG